MVAPRRCTSLLALCLLAVVVLALPEPASACEGPLVCPEYWEWSWEICGCECTSWTCCYFQPYYCTSDVCCEIWGQEGCPNQNCQQAALQSNRDAQFASCLSGKPGAGASSRLFFSSPTRQ